MHNNGNEGIAIAWSPGIEEYSEIWGIFLADVNVTNECKIEQ